jgi:hypothetical protein
MFPSTPAGMVGNDSAVVPVFGAHLGRRRYMRGWNDAVRSRLVRLHLAEPLRVRLAFCLHDNKPRVVPIVKGKTTSAPPAQ